MIRLQATSECCRAPGQEIYDTLKDLIQGNARFINNACYPVKTTKFLCTLTEIMFLFSNCFFQTINLGLQRLNVSGPVSRDLGFADGPTFGFILIVHMNSLIYLSAI